MAKRYLFLELGGWPEILILTAPVTAIKTAEPDCHIDLITGQQNKEILDLTTVFDNVFYLNESKSSLKELLSVLKKIHYDFYIDLQRRIYPQSQKFSSKVNSDHKIGYNKPAKKKPFDLNLSKTNHPHLIDHYLKCLNLLEINHASGSYSLETKPIKIETERLSLLIHLQAGTIRTEIVEKLLNSHLQQMIDIKLLCAKNDIAPFEKFQERLNTYSNLNEAIESVITASYLLTASSWLVQVADILAVPVIYLSDGTDYDRLLSSIQTESVILTPRSKKQSIQEISLDAMIHGIRSVCGFI
ncbi:MAG: hypothetical protein KDD94_08760 [Calditrichaeota bacterium]|nr:hypothetical protein [Calditrichota bacterium]